MKLPHQKHANTVLGLTLDNGVLEAAWLRRTNGSAEIKKIVRAPLTLDLLRNEAELVGQEIRNILNEAGIRERKCVVGLPSEWIMSMQTTLPELAEEDVDSFLQLEAEQKFPANLDQLQIAVSRQQTDTGRHATQLGATISQISRFEAILTAAQLKPIQLNPSIAALPGAVPKNGEGTITAVIGEDRIGLLVAAGGGIVTIRSLDNVVDLESGEKRLLSNVVSRELRITLGQMPEDLKSRVSQMQVFGAGHLAAQLVAELKPMLDANEISVQQITQAEGIQHGLTLKGEATPSRALGLAAQFLSDSRSQLDFLPPKPTFWQQISSRYSGKKLAYGGGVAGAVAVLVCGMFIYQQVQLSSLRSEWNGMKDEVAGLDDLQTQIRTFRPWYDQSVASLHILKSVTEAFPEEGSVSARTVDIRNQSAVTVTGVAENNSDFLNMLDNLRDQKTVAQLKVDQMRGKAPLQFSFNFNWQKGGTQ